MFYFSNFQKLKDIRHYVSGKKGGSSGESQDMLNVSFAINDQPENVIQNRRRIAELLQIEPSHLVFPSQVHSSNVQQVDSSNIKSGFSETDALITKEKGICISVMSADCIPVLLYDPEIKAIAAIHAGWRGTMAGIVSETIKSMMNNYGTVPENLYAGIGPGICQEKYEIGEEVIEAVEEYYTENEIRLLLSPSKKQGKAYLDLWEANKLQLLKMGLIDKNIEVAELCTFSNPEKFFSARRAPMEGRFSAGIMLI